MENQMKLRYDESQDKTAFHRCLRITRRYLQKCIFCPGNHKLAHDRSSSISVKSPGGKPVMKNQICLIVDSSSSLPRDVIAQYGIGEVSFYYRFGENDYTHEKAGSGIQDFYLHMEQDPYDLPHTAAPNIEDWDKVLEEWYQKGAKDFILMTIASALSASLMSADSAGRMLKERHEDVRITAFDSMTCACGLGAFEIAVAQMIEAGWPYERIVETAESMTKPGQITSLFTVRDLTYMKAGGRIGGAAAFIGNLVSIKPVCEFIDGVVHPVRAVPGRRRSLRSMIDTAVSRIDDPEHTIITMQHALYPEDAEFMVRHLHDRMGQELPVYVTDLGIVVGTHSGPGAIGIGLARSMI